MNDASKIVSNLIKLTKQGLIKWDYTESFVSGHTCSCSAEVEGAKVEISRDYEAIFFRYRWFLYVAGALMEDCPKEPLKVLIVLVYADFKAKESEKLIESIETLTKI